MKIIREPYISILLKDNDRSTTYTKFSGFGEGRLVGVAETEKMMGVQKVVLARR